MLLTLLMVLCSTELARSEEPWLGSYAGDRVPSRETVSSAYLVEYSTGVQKDLIDRMGNAHLRLKSKCQTEGGHALINVLSAVTIADVLSRAEKNLVFEKGVLVVVTADCVTKSRLIDSKSVVLP
ncbi:MAG: hypothetical protein Q8S75_16005, partial [Nitrospirota bacterium]|nr:hypothetical protein [Nitrospirota bacterium]